jgi:hypothetical protein
VSPGLIDMFAGQLASEWRREPEAEALAVTLKRRDPRVIAGRAHRVLDDAMRMHADWPRKGRRFIGESALYLDEALKAYRAAEDEGRDTAPAAEDAAIRMGILLLSVAVSLGKATADEMARNASEVAA